MDGPGYHSSTFTMVRGNIILAWQWSCTSTMVRGNIILAWQWSGTSIHIYGWPGISQLNIHNGPGQHHSSMAMVRDIRNGPGHPFTFTDGLGYHSSTFTMVQGNIKLAWQWSGTSIHIYGWPGISHLNIHNGLGHVCQSSRTSIHVQRWSRARLY